MAIVQQLIVLMVIAALVGIPSYILMMYARGIAPALTSSRYKSGVGGVMIVFVIGQVASFVRALWETSYMAVDLFYMLSKSTEQLASGLMAVLPNLLTLLLGAYLLWILVSRRTAPCVGAVVVLLWIIGPGAALLQGWYFSLQLTTLSLVQLFGWALVWTAYFVLSPRVALTYATIRGRRIAAGAPRV